MRVKISECICGRVDKSTGRTFGCAAQRQKNCGYVCVLVYVLVQANVRVHKYFCMHSFRIRAHAYAYAYIHANVHLCCITVGSSSRAVCIMANASSASIMAKNCLIRDSIACAIAFK